MAYYTFNKVFLITMQTCTEEKFCSFATMAGEKSQLLQLIMCSDGLTDTQNCRSLVLSPAQGTLDAWERLLNGP